MMILDSFRITNFRSIVDTDWCKFSPDGVTVFVGQNESGKTSVLAALNSGLSDTKITEDDIRTGADYPKIYFRIILTPSDLNELLTKYDLRQVGALVAYLEKNDLAITISREWKKSPETGNVFQGAINVEKDEKISKVLSKALARTIVAPDAPTKTPTETAITPPADVTVKGPTETPTTSSVTTTVKSSEESQAKALDPGTSVQRLNLTTRDLVDVLYKTMPKSTLFDQETGLLPSTIDISPDGTLSGNGAVAANNFLSIANLTLKELLTDDLRTRTDKFERANARISQDFASFWTQVIGKSGPLALECELRHYDANVQGQAGKPYLVFWIVDGRTKLYFKQRSLGLRWFMSFYLQLKATERQGVERIFLLDEPGANLHSRAQSDVLRLINRLRKDIKVIYCTHSPDMIEHDKFYRIHAVQREGDVEATPTRIISAHRLGTASRDTLSPVLTAMGMDLSSQNVIKKANNVLIEEMSGFYYLTAFWKLTNEQQTAHFIAATGVSNVEPLANMFRGWGLSFIVAIDDEPNGRRVYNNLKRHFFGDNEQETRANVIKFRDCKGIEDVFSRNDFKRFILKVETAEIENNNSDFFRNSTHSKHVLAYQFLLSVRQGEVSWGDLELATQEHIKNIVSDISTRLKAKRQNREVAVQSRDG